MLGALAVLGVEWARPAGLVALVLPVVLWLLSRRRARPTPRATGTFALWEAVQASTAHDAARTRRATPLALWFAIAALGIGALALAGPRGADLRRPRLWTLVADGSPSMTLPVDAAAGPSAERRLDAALRVALALLTERAASVDRVRWISSGRTTLELAPDEVPADDWFAPFPGVDAEPIWALHDREGAIWVTDRAPVDAPRRAGFAASGGAAVPGPIATVRTEAGERVFVVWDGERLARGTEPLARRAIACERPSGSAGALFGELVELWARTSGFVVDARNDDPALVVEVGAGAGERVEVEAEGYGWSLRGTASDFVPPAAQSGGVAEGPGAGEPWLVGVDAAGRAHPIVLAAPGHVRIGWHAVEEPRGDPAAFALAWSRLFDSCVLPAPGVVALAEREAAGEPRQRAPERAPLLDARDRPGARSLGAVLDAWLAGAATLLALAALLVSPRRRVFRR